LLTGAGAFSLDAMISRRSAPVAARDQEKKASVRRAA
jgi:hypothetical protein